MKVSFDFQHTKHSILVFYSFLQGWELRAYYYPWLCSQGLFLVVLQETYVVPGMLDSCYMCSLEP